MLRPFDLNLRHLRALATIAAHGSMSAAADAVGLSQPALTQGLAKLERQLGSILFERRPDGVRPTADGVLLAARATAAYDHLAAATRAVLRGGGRGFARPERLMTATQLNAFLALVDAGSFIGAAQATALSQPALHRAVRDLEQVCGTALAERRGRGVALSAAGRRIARGVRLASGEIAAGLAEIAGDDTAAARIVVGAMPLSRAIVVPRAIAAFLAGAPRGMVEVVEGSWRELAEPLRDGAIDLMVGALRADDPPGLEQRHLFDDRLVIVGRAGHPLAQVAHPDLAVLAGYGWIVGPAGTPLRAHWDALFASGPPPAPVECGSVMVIRGVLGDSDLLTLLSRDQVALELASGVLVQIGDPLAHSVRQIGVTTRTGWRPTAAQRRFVALLAAAAASTRLLKSE